MSSTAINFKAGLLIGKQAIPLASEIAFGDQQSQDGVDNGFVFKPGKVPATARLFEEILSLFNWEIEFEFQFFYQCFT